MKTDEDQITVQTHNPFNGEIFICSEEENKIIEEIEKLNSKTLDISNKDLKFLIKMILRARNAATDAIIKAFIETRK